MKHIKLGDLNVSRIGLGAMGMSAAYTGAGTDDPESIRTIHRALELGVTFLDTAESYGPFVNEGRRQRRRDSAGRRRAGRMWPWRRAGSGNRRVRGDAAARRISGDPAKALADGRALDKYRDIIFFPRHRRGGPHPAVQPPQLPRLGDVPPGQALMNSSRSALMVSAWVVGMPCGKPR